MQRAHNISIDFGNGVITGPDTDFALLGYDGLTNMPTDSVVNEFSTSAGGSVQSVRPKTRVLTFEIENPNITWSDFCSLFPIGKYRITISRDGVLRYIDAYRNEELGQVGEGSVLDPAGLQVSFIAEFPFFRQKDTEEIAVLGISEGGLIYPHAYPIVFDTWSSNDTIEINNRGAYATPFIFRVTPEQNLSSITLNVGNERMQITGEIKAGQSLIVDTAKYSARLDGLNVFSYVDGWPKLQPGNNLITLSSLAGNVSIAFEPLFEGV